MDVERRALIARRVRESIEARQRAGTYRPPRPLVSDQVAARIVRERSSGRSLRGIARALTLEGVPAPRGGRWGHSTVRKIYLRERVPRLSSCSGGMRSEPPAGQA
ncbi:MAG: recombinase family protein [Thermoleophilaceae bacterium]